MAEQAKLLALINKNHNACGGNTISHKSPLQLSHLHSMEFVNWR